MLMTSQLSLFDDTGTTFMIGDVVRALPTRYHDITETSGKLFLIRKITNDPTTGKCYWGAPERTSPEIRGPKKNRKVITGGFVDFCLNPLGAGKDFTFERKRKESE